MFNKYRRYFSQMWTYGIGHNDLTPREKKMWVTFLYLLMGTAWYYQMKDLIRTSDEGPWSLREHLFSKPKDIDIHVTPVELTKDQMSQLYTQLLNAPDNDVEKLRDIWVQTDDAELTKTQFELKATILAEYESRGLAPF